MAPDTSGPGGRRTQVYAYEADGYAAPVNATLDITDSVNGASTGSPVSLVFIGSNFRGGGQFSIVITTDQDKKSINTSLDAFSSEQWVFNLVKV